MARPIGNDRWSARGEARVELACAAERGAAPARVAALRETLESLEARVAAACVERGPRPMRGQLVGVAPPGPASAERDADLAGSPIDRVLGIPGRAPIELNLGDLPGIGLGQPD